MLGLQYDPVPRPEEPGRVFRYAPLGDFPEKPLLILGLVTGLDEY